MNAEESVRLPVVSTVARRRPASANLCDRNHVAEEATERCTTLTSVHDLAALSDGTLSVVGRFRFARHIRRCLTCKLMLLIILDEAERHGRPGMEGIKAVATLADVDTHRISDWLIAMFCSSGCTGDDE